MVEDLKNLPHFKDVDQKVLESLILSNQIIKRSYNKGITVHEQYSECYGMDIVLSGNLIEPRYRKSLARALFIVLIIA